LNSPPRSPNSLLAALPVADFELIRPHLRPFELTGQAVLVKGGERIRHVYFPHSGIISLVMRLIEGDTVEAAMIGRDSVYGSSAALDGDIALNEAIVQLQGTASVMDVAPFRSAVEQSVHLRATLVRHERAVLAQALQSAACNASHTVDARLSRWLLRARDLSGDNLPLTQEFLGQMLGVQRTSVSVVANTLQQAGLIRYSRGHIHITNAPGLMESACECYSAVKTHYDRLRNDD
jgi:CRP-like cAMP-binding protein